MQWGQREEGRRENVDKSLYCGSTGRNGKGKGSRFGISSVEEFQRLCHRGAVPSRLMPGPEETRAGGQWPEV